MSPSEVCEMQAEEGEPPPPEDHVGHGQRKERPPEDCVGCGQLKESPLEDRVGHDRGSRAPLEDRQGRACQRITPQCAGGSTVLKSGK